MLSRLPRGFTHPMRIGTGAFASVFRVHQSALDRKVAFKIIHEKNAVGRSELLKEAKTQAKLRAGCVPQVYDAFEWKNCVLKGGLDDHRQGIRQGFFDGDVPVSDLPGTQLFAYYTVDSYHNWRYDPGTNEYLRYQEISDTRNGKPESYAPLIDQVTGKTVHAANVVYLLAYHTFSNTFDEEDEVYQIDLTGSGEAYVFRDGIGIPARWIRTNVDQPLLLVTTAGAPIYLRPGITFYEVIGSASYVDQSAGEWNFHHETP